jgi:hypothetical protein
MLVYGRYSWNSRTMRLPAFGMVRIWSAVAVFKLIFAIAAAGAVAVGISVATVVALASVAVAASATGLATGSVAAGAASL